MKNKILLTGFEPFGEYEKNPTMDIVKGVSDIENVEKVILPVDFEQTKIVFNQVLERVQPQYIISLGLNAKIGWIALESFALNIGYDYLKNQWQADLQPNGHPAGRTGFDTKKWAENINQNGCPSLISNHAGTYLCNFVYYYALQYTQARAGDALFVHLPFSMEYMSELCQQKNRAYPSLPLAEMINSIEWILKQICTKNEDVLL